MKNKNSVIVFDFDGTIADTMSHIKDIMNDLSQKFNFKKIDENNLEELRGKRTQEVFKAIGVPLVKIPIVLKRVRTIFTQKIKDFKPIKGIKETLIQLNEKGFQLGIITSSPLNNVNKFLKNNNLDLFDFIYSERNIFQKDRKMLRLLKKKKLEPNQVFYVGDETRDIEAARKAGVKTVAVTWGFNNEAVLRGYKPDFLVKQPKDLTKIFT